MFRFSLSQSLSLLALIAAAQLGAIAAQAQDTTEAAPATDAPAEGAAAAGSDLSMGQSPADGIGSTYVKESFDAWELRCVRTESGADPCQLYQLLKDGSGNSVAEVGLFTLPAGGEAAAGATVIAPLETLLTAGLRIGVDGAEPKVYPFSFCSTAGCVARVGFTAAEVDAFKAGNKAIVTIVPAVAPDQTVALDVSLKGFTAGYEAVAAAQAAVDAAQSAAPAEPQE
jgi:invasion protein IalB